MSIPKHTSEAPRKAPEADASLRAGGMEAGELNTVPAPSTREPVSKVSLIVRLAVRNGQIGSLLAALEWALGELPAPAHNSRDDYRDGYRVASAALALARGEEG